MPAGRRDDGAVLSVRTKPNFPGVRSLLKILGYPDRYSVAPGETIAFKVSLEEGTHFDARVERVVHGDANPAGPGTKFRPAPAAPDGRHAGKPQRIDAGSYMIVDQAPALAEKAFTFFA